MQKNYVKNLALLIVLAMLAVSIPIVSQAKSADSASDGVSFVESTESRSLSKSGSNADMTFSLDAKKNADNTYTVTLHAKNAEGLKYIDGTVYYDSDVFNFTGEEVKDGPFVDAYNEITSRYEIISSYNSGINGKVILGVAIANQILSDSEYLQQCERKYVKPADITVDDLVICSFKLSVIDGEAEFSTLEYVDEVYGTTEFTVDLKNETSESTTQDKTDEYYKLVSKKTTDGYTVSLVANDAEGLNVVDGTFTYDENVLKLEEGSDDTSYNNFDVNDIISCQNSPVRPGEYFSAYGINGICEFISFVYNPKSAGEVILGIAIANQIYSDDEYAELVDRYWVEDAADITTKNMEICSLDFTVLDEDAESTTITYTDKNNGETYIKINLKNGATEETTVPDDTDTPAEKALIDIAVEAVGGIKEVLESGEKVAVATVGVSAETLINSTDNAKLLDEAGNEVDSNTPIATGMKLCVGSETVAIAVLGDIDSDGEISVSDARLALRAAVKLDTLTGVYEIAAKVGNVQISVTEARLVLRAAVKLDDPKSWLK